MRLRPTFAALTLLASGGIASAQADRLQGPLLIPPAPGEYRSTPLRDDSYRRNGRSGGYTFENDPRYSRGISPDDPRLATMDQWHQRLFRQPADQAELSAWQRHFERGGSAYDLIADLLASDDYFQRTGGNFEDWFTSAAAATGRPVTSKEVWEWGIAYRRDQNRLSIARRLLDVSGLFGNRAGQPVIRQHDHGAYEAGSDYGTYGYGTSYGASNGIQLSGYDASVQPGYGYPGYGYGPDGHGRHSSHQHTAGYGPVAAPPSPADLIADWYRTYNGREIQPQELNKWMSDLNKGMPLDEVYASVLGGDEWYIRTGRSAPNWAASTLEALGQSANGQTVNNWLERLRRNGGNRFRTALEMVRAFGGAPVGLDSDDDD